MKEFHDAGSFQATREDGSTETICIIQEIDDGIRGLRSLRTLAGQTVQRIAKGHYRIFRGEDLHSAAPDAP